MSAIENLRPKSTRRAFLSTGAVAALLGGTAVAAAAAEPDPIFTLVRIEQAAWDAVGEAIDDEEALNQAFDGTEWDRLPRAPIGIYTRLHDADFNPIPQDQLTEEVMYQTRGELERHHAGQKLWIDSGNFTLAEGAERHAANDARHAKLMEAVEKDAKAIAAAREAFGLVAASAKVGEASAAAQAALDALCTATPTTAAGLLAMLDVCWARNADCLCDEQAVSIRGAFDAVRAFVSGRAA